MTGGRKQKTVAIALIPTGAVQRFSYAVMLFLAIVLLVLSIVRPQAGLIVQSRVADFFSPLMMFVAQPVAKATETVATLGSLTELRAENERMREENRHLRDYQTALMRLEAENKGLRDLLKMPVEPTQRVVTSRVIADAGGPFMRNVLIYAGQNNGLKVGQVAMAGGGLAGRVVSVGRSSSRILLINDINARVPVLVERSRERALIVGDNSTQLLLTHVPPEARIVAGDRLLTSGVGGVYPAGLVVGVVSAVDASDIRVKPAADLERLELLQIIDTGLPSDLLLPESTQAMPPVGVISSSQSLPRP